MPTTKCPRCQARVLVMHAIDQTHVLAYGKPYTEMSAHQQERVRKARFGALQMLPPNLRRCTCAKSAPAEDDEA